MKYIGKLKIIKRLNNSKNGNPCFLLKVGDFFCQTEPDSKLGYSVSNFEGQKVEITTRTFYGKETLKKLNVI
jgi:hypothetical protein